MRLRAAAALALGLAAGAAWAAEPPPVQREIKSRMDIDGGRREVVLGRVDMAPGASVGRHTHPGPETGYVVAGQLTLKVAGQPDRHLVPGQNYAIPAGVAHDAIADKGLRENVSLTAVWVVDKGKPLSTAAP